MFKITFSSLFQSNSHSTHCSRIFFVITISNLFSVNYFKNIRIIRWKKINDKDQEYFNNNNNECLRETWSNVKTENGWFSSSQSHLNPFLYTFFFLVLTFASFIKIQKIIIQQQQSITTTIRATIIHHRMSMSREAEIIQQRKIEIVMIRSRIHHHHRWTISRSRETQIQVQNVDQVAMVNQSEVKNHGIIHQDWTTSWRVVHFGKIIQVKKTINR